MLFLPSIRLKKSKYKRNIFALQLLYLIWLKDEHATGFGIILLGKTVFVQIEILARCYPVGAFIYCVTQSGGGGQPLCYAVVQMVSKMVILALKGGGDSHLF